MTAPTQTRLWYWNLAGATYVLCSPENVEATRRRLLSEGAVIWGIDTFPTERPLPEEEAA